MKHLVYLAIAVGALAMMGCGGAAPSKPADPPAAAPAPPLAAAPAAEYSCGDGYIFDTDQLPGPEGAVVNDVFYWGSSTSGAARCFSDTRNDSIIGRVESNAGDATGAVVLSVTLPDGPRWYFILQFPDGTYCSAATAGDGRATCFATVERDATGFRLDDLPADPLPVPTGAPEPPVENPGPGGGDEGDGHTGAPEPEEPSEEEPTTGNEVSFTSGAGHLIASERPAASETGFRHAAGLYIYAPINERRWYLLLGNRDDGPRDGPRYGTWCFAATTGDGKPTCSSDKIRLERSLADTFTAPDDFPTPTAPQSAAGNAAVYGSPTFVSRGSQQQMIREVGYKLPGWPDLPPNERRWFLVLHFSDGTWCNAATPGDGRVTCVGKVEMIPGYGAVTVPYVP